MEMKKVTIEVTRQHIDAGQRQKCESCPVALAINEHLAPECYAHVSSGPSGIYDQDPDGGFYAFDAPQKMADFIVWFDSREVDVEPFSFELELPVHVLKAAA